MDLQAAETIKEKRGILSRLTVAFCLILTAALLISSLASPGRAFSREHRALSALPTQLSLPN